MANDVDDFVLRYTIDLRDSVARLEKLHEKMDGVKKRGKDAAGGLKEFASGASAELNKLVPGIDAVSSAVKVMGAEFAAAAGGVAVLAVGVKAILDLRSQFNAQRPVEIATGLSGARLEDYQRKLQRTGGGYVSRDQAAEGIKGFAAMATAAYTDPTKMGREARIMRMLGVNVGERGNPTGTVHELTQLAAGLQGKSEGDVMGIARAIGMDPNWLMSVKRQGANGMAHITDMNANEIENRAAAQDSVDKFNKELIELKENFNELEIALGGKLLPSANKFLEWVTQLVDKFNGDTKRNAANGIPWYGKITGPGDNPNPNQVAAGRVLGPDGKPVAAASGKKPVDLDKLADQQGEQNKEALANTNNMALAINLFASAVQSFSNSVDLQKAWAAWAGEIGRAGGLSGSSNAAIPGTAAASGGSRGLRNNNPGNIEDGPFARSQAGYIGTDGRFAKFSTMEEGAAAHDALIANSYLKNGLNTPRKIIAKYAPANENNQAAYLAFFKAHNIDPDADVSKNPAALALFDQLQMRYESGYGGKGIGQGRADLNIQSVQQTIADFLHAPLSQIQNGGVFRGDASFAVSQIEAGMQNDIGKTLGEITAAKQQVAQGLMNPQRLSQLQLHLRDQTRGLALMRQYASGVADEQRPGGRQWTQGDRPIQVNFNITGNDPKAIADEVHKVLNNGMADVLNHFSSGVKG